MIWLYYFYNFKIWVLKQTRQKETGFSEIQKIGWKQIICIHVKKLTLILCWKLGIKWPDHESSTGKESCRKRISLRIITFTKSYAVNMLDSVIKEHLVKKVILSFFILFNMENGSDYAKSSGRRMDGVNM